MLDAQCVDDCGIGIVREGLAEHWALSRPADEEEEPSAHVEPSVQQEPLGIEELAVTLPSLSLR